MTENIITHIDNGYVAGRVDIEFTGTVADGVTLDAAMNHIRANVTGAQDVGADEEDGLVYFKLPANGETPQSRLESLRNSLGARTITNRAKT